MNSNRDQSRLWRDPALGSAGVELFTGNCFDHRYQPHFHEEIVIAAFTGGAQRHRVGHRQGVAMPGSILIIPAGETHAGESPENGGWSYRAFYPDAGTLAAIAADLFAGPNRHALEFGTQPLHEDSALCHRLTALHGFVEDNTADPLARQQAFTEAMLLVLQLYARPALSPRDITPERRAISRAIEYAHAHFADPALNATDMAAAACLSPYHFMRCFRTTIGLTAHQYVTQIRIQKARRLLAGGTPAAEVAAAAGFTDQSHLIRHFRLAFGVTPGQYVRDTKRRHRNIFPGQD